MGVSIMKKELSEGVNWSSFLVMYDHMVESRWTIDEVRAKVSEEIAQLQAYLQDEPNKDNCPTCGAELIIKRELKETIIFCSECDFER